MSKDVNSVSETDHLPTLDQIRAIRDFKKLNHGYILTETTRNELVKLVTAQAEELLLIAEIPKSFIKSIEVPESLFAKRLLTNEFQAQFKRELETVIKSIEKIIKYYDDLSERRGGGLNVVAH